MHDKSIKKCNKITAKTPAKHPQKKTFHFISSTRNHISVLIPALTYNQSRSHLSSVSRKCTSNLLFHFFRYFPYFPHQFACFFHTYLAQAGSTRLSWAMFHTRASKKWIRGYPIAPECPEQPGARYLFHGLDS